MKKYKLQIDSYELSLLKYLVYERKCFLNKKSIEVPESMKAGVSSAFNNCNKLLKKLVGLEKNISDYYKYDLIGKKDEKIKKCLTN